MSDNNKTYAEVAKKAVTNSDETTSDTDESVNDKYHPDSIGSDNEDTAPVEKEGVITSFIHQLLSTFR